MKKTLLTLVTLAFLGGLVYTLIPSGEDIAQKLERAEVDQAKQISLLALSGKREAIELSAANTKIGFGCSKTIAGKTLTMRGGWSGAFGSRLTGQALVDRQQRQLVQLTLQIDVASLWSEHDQLSEALRTKGFFQVDEHPQATFISTKIEAVSNDVATNDVTAGDVTDGDVTDGDVTDGNVTDGNVAQTEATHRIEGNFSLNGIEKSITFPAQISLSESELHLRSQFSLRRKDFQVRFADSGGLGLLLTDEDISDRVALDVTISEVSLRQGAVDGKKVDTTGSALPSDHSALPTTYIETIPATQISFEMVLVPGDPDSQLQPLYVGKHEVTWEEFMPWVDGRDLEDVDGPTSNGLGELRAMKLRPSPPYGSVDRGFGMVGRPALGMSRLSAKKYCQWLRKQTGKPYRLPTDAEWERIYVAGGGSLEGPPMADEAMRTAVFIDNSWNDSLEDWATQPVGSAEPNTLGIYDMAGNVCEWVVDTGEKRAARGGHFDSDRDKLGVGRHEEGPYWNRDYPNEPKSIWWFVNARWVGFRLVCDLP